MEARSKSKSMRWTYAEFARLPSEGSTRYEVIAGELVVTPAPGRRHQRIATDLVTLLNGFVRQHDLGEVFAAPSTFCSPRVTTWSRTSYSCGGTGWAS